MKHHLRRAARAGAVLGTATAVVLLPVAAAEAAAKIEAGPHNALGTGLANGSCAQAKIIADLPAYPDRQYSSPRECGHQQGTTWRVGKNESSTIRGVKVQVCRVHSDGSDQHCARPN